MVFADKNILSKLCGRELKQVFGGWRREQIRREFACFCHVALNLHFALHERNLRVQLAHADRLKVLVSHRKSGVWFFRLAFFCVSLSVLQINLINEVDRTTLFTLDFKTENRANLWNQRFSESLIKIGSHHPEDVL